MTEAPTLAEPGITDKPVGRSSRPGLIATAITAGAALIVPLWLLVTSWSGVIHGHPSYLVALVITMIGGLVGLVRVLRRRADPRGWRWALWAFGILGAFAWLAMLIYLAPLSATEPSLNAMRSDANVTVTETPTAITMQPTAASSTSGIVFQPGARVDARAYAGLMRPLAEQGQLVIIPKQPLGVGLLATGALDTARKAHPEITSWVVGGHSLGGTAAADMASAPTPAGVAPVDGLLLYAAYPSSDISSALDPRVRVLSISASNDGLATSADIEASTSDLPPDTQFVVINGGVHAFFGDYGEQSGDGSPTISRADAQAQIKAATLGFLERLRQPL